MTTRLLAGLAISAFLALGALAGIDSPQASAAVRRPLFRYRVTFSGEGSYSRTLTRKDGSTETVSATWGWTTIFPAVAVGAGFSPLAASRFEAVGPGNAGNGEWTIAQTGGGQRDCSNGGTLGLRWSPDGGGGGFISVRRAGGRTRGVALNLLALEGYETISGGGDDSTGCDPLDFWQEVIIGSADPGGSYAEEHHSTVQPLSADLVLTQRELAAPLVVRPVSISGSELVPSDCAGPGAVTCEQSFTWSGDVTVRRLRSARG